MQALRRRLPTPIFELAAAAANVPEFLQVRREIAQFSPAFLYKRHARFDVGALRAAHRAGIPSVLEVNSLFTQGAYHGFEPLVMKRLGVRLERDALRLATVVLAVSSPLARQIRALANRPVVVMPNGADPARFDVYSARPEDVRARHGLQAMATIGWSGILRQWHGVEILLDAVATLPNVQLLIVGDGPGRAALELRAQSLGLQRRLIVTGRVDHRDMPNYIAAMDVAVVADERTGIASPMKLLEYMAMERAVVAPRLENIQDVVDDDRDGLLFTQGRAEELSKTLERLIADNVLRGRLGKAARAKVETQHNWRRNAESVISALSNSRTSSPS
jgi:glycosyltransferase involved in cell wall biosynthesis